MATDKQIAANRLNAQNSTGPRTDDGKRRSRRNAFRHGLTAETVIDIHEDPAAYRALERAIMPTIGHAPISSLNSLRALFRCCGAFAARSRLRADC